MSLLRTEWLLFLLLMCWTPPAIVIFFHTHTCFYARRVSCTSMSVPMFCRSKSPAFFVRCEVDGARNIIEY